jgi:hypothetical protein
VACRCASAPTGSRWHAEGCRFSVIKTSPIRVAELVARSKNRQDLHNALLSLVVGRFPGGSWSKGLDANVHGHLPQDRLLVGGTRDPCFQGCRARSPAHRLMAVARCSIPRAIRRTSRPTSSGGSKRTPAPTAPVRLTSTPADRSAQGAVIPPRLGERVKSALRLRDPVDETI